MQGGTLGNLSALVAARHDRARAGAAAERPARWVVACSAEAHSSIAHAARVMDVDVLVVPVDERGRITGDALEPDPAPTHGAGDVFAVVATGGTTNFGDRRRPRGDRRRLRGAAACGCTSTARTAWPPWRPRAPATSSTGIERADSFIVDPHKWLFAPFDACALVYRDPAKGRAAHAQTAGYLDVLNASRRRVEPLRLRLPPDPAGAWAAVLVLPGRARHARRTPRPSRRPSRVARVAADEIRGGARTSSCSREPDLSVVVFRRIGWTTEQYYDWSDRLMPANYAFVTPTSHAGETVTRFAMVNPRTRSPTCAASSTRWREGGGFRPDTWRSDRRHRSRPYPGPRSAGVAQTASAPDL